jgi:hypothetical protein
LISDGFFIQNGWPGTTKSLCLLYVATIPTNTISKLAGHFRGSGHKARFCDSYDHHDRTDLQHQILSRILHNAGHVATRFDGQVGQTGYILVYFRTVWYVVDLLKLAVITMTGKCVDIE